MNEYSIFLGSSIQQPVSYDRCALGNFIRKVNDAFRMQQIPAYLYLFMCELDDASIIPGSNLTPQDNYDKQILNADLFLNLYHDHAGQFTVHELDIATAAEVDTKVFFRSCERCDASISQLPARLQTDCIPYERYTHVDHVKFAVIRWLKQKDPSLPITIGSDTLEIGRITVLKSK